MRLKWKHLVIVIVLIGLLFAVSRMGNINANVVKNGNMRASLETNQGDIVIELFDGMPITVRNFEKLVSEGFYDETKFHRVIDGFMIQGGDPLTKDNSQKNRWGTGGPGYQIEDEFGNIGNLRGTISMANAGPNTGGSQFFINLVDNNYLDAKHPVFGKVVEGMEVVDKIAKAEKDEVDRPIEDIVILRAKIL